MSKRGSIEEACRGGAGVSLGRYGRGGQLRDQRAGVVAMACTWDAGGGGDMRAGVVAAGTRWVFDPVHAGTHDSDYGG